jgi:hypothetical protein
VAARDHGGVVLDSEKHLVIQPFNKKGALPGAARLRGFGPFAG